MGLLDKFKKKKKEEEAFEETEGMDFGEEGLGPLEGEKGLEEPGVTERMEGKAFEEIGFEEPGIEEEGMEGPELAGVAEKPPKLKRGLMPKLSLFIFPGLLIIAVLAGLFIGYLLSPSAKKALSLLTAGKKAKGPSVEERIASVNQKIKETQKQLDPYRAFGRPEEAVRIKEELTHRQEILASIETIGNKIADQTVKEGDLETAKVTSTEVEKALYNEENTLHNIDKETRQLKGRIEAYGEEQQLLKAEMERLGKRMASLERVRGR